jgi:DNA polymerase
MRSRDLGRYVEDLGWRVAAVPKLESPDDPLAELERSAQSCTKCRLCESRRSVVFGEGRRGAAVMFIGEGPGAEEDRTGRPFVGQAGQLLDRMIFAIGFDRSDVYIANVVKCRPPGNRDPRDDEAAACAPYLDRQIELVGPQVIVALGKPAARRLTGSTAAIGSLRGRWMSYRGVPLMPVYHPAYLLRTPSAKRQMWDDLKKVIQRLESTSGG